MSEPYFRGFHAIGEVASKARRLAEHCAKFTDCVRVLRLYRRDYDLVARWPKAAALHGFEFTGPAISFQGFKVECDTSRPRYGVNDEA